MRISGWSKSPGTGLALRQVMLRITRSTSNGTTLLKLEGKLLAAWAVELLEQSSSADTVELDLSQVSFVDRAGLVALGDLLGRGARIVACAGFVAQLLEMETR